MPAIRRDRSEEQKMADGADMVFMDSLFILGLLW